MAPKEVRFQPGKFSPLSADASELRDFSDPHPNCGTGVRISHWNSPAERRPVGGVGQHHDQSADGHPISSSDRLCGLQPAVYYAGIGGAGYLY